jgi:hypothetical protein
MPDQVGTSLNLDRLAARHAQAIIAAAKKNGETAKDIDNTVTKALGVLQENGLYAAALFLTSRSKKENKRALLTLDNLLGMLSDMDFPGWSARPDAQQTAAVLRYMSETIAQDLPRLLLAKETCEQMLIYARYGAKAWGNESGE